MPRCRLIKGRSHDFAAYSTRHFRNFFRTLVNQQHNHDHIGVIGSDRVRNMLQHHGLTRFRRGHQQSTLAFADRSDHIDHTPGNILFAGNIPLQLHRLGRK